MRRRQLCVVFWCSLIDPMVISLNAFGALRIVGHRRLRVYIIDARDGINEVVVGQRTGAGSEDAGDVVRPPCCKAGLSNKCNAWGRAVNLGLLAPVADPSRTSCPPPYGPHGSKRKHGVLCPPSRAVYHGFIATDPASSGLRSLITCENHVRSGLRMALRAIR